MNTNIPRLTQTKTGFYGYRRKIKKGHRHLFEGKRELKKSFDTKDLRHALRLHKEMDRWFDSVLAAEGFGLQISPKIAPKQKVVEVVKDLKNRSLHPSDIPSVSAVDNTQKFQHFLNDALNIAPVIEKYNNGETSLEELTAQLNEMKKSGKPFAKQIEYRVEVEVLKKLLDKKYSKPRSKGLGANPNDRVPVEWDNSDPDVIKYKIMTGDPDFLPDPTLSDAMYTYLKQNLEKPRNADTKKKWEGAVTSLCQKLSMALPLGMKTRLDAMDFTLLQDFVNDTWPNASTRARNLRTYAAVIANWNRLHPEQTVPNHFSVLVAENKSKEERDSKVRRSFTPDEHGVFMQRLLDSPDPEIKTIGLIMETYGAPTGEAACLLRQDVKLKAETPHLIIRNNKYRILGKRRLARAVPIVEPLLSHLKDYIDNHFTGSNTDLLFPQFGEGRHASGDRSKKLTDFVDNQRPDDEDLLSPYSLRHTFKDRYQRARVPQDIGEYIFGHNSEQASKVHAKYGTGRGVEDLVDYMKDIVAVKEWGFFEEYDD